MKNVFGIVNFHDSPVIPPLTDSRPLGSTSFLGRYAFCDFALSNLCNSGIPHVGLLVKDYPRSILKHLGSMDSWVTNTKIGMQRVMYNEPAHMGKVPNTDINNLIENDWLLYSSDAQYLVVVPAHLVISIDLRPIVKRHIERGDEITVVNSLQRNAASHWHGNLLFSGDSETGIKAELNSEDAKGSQYVALGIYVINRTTLIELMQHFSSLIPSLTLRDLVLLAAKNGNTRISTYTFDGWVKNVDSFQHYMEVSLDMLERKNFDGLYRKEWPVFTLTHDTPPALYGKDSHVTHSYISNGANIEGEVSGSIIARHVYIGKGAVIKNSIIFSNVRINEGAYIENALIDKYTVVEKDHKVVGKKKDPLYVPQGSIK